MTFEPFTGEFNREQFVFGKEQLKPIIKDAEPGTVAYMEWQWFTIDTDGAAWVDAYAVLETEEEMLAGECFDPDDYVRVIMTDVGVVIDESAYEYDASTSKGRNAPSIDPPDEEEQERLLPVNHWIGNSLSLSFLADSLRSSFGIVLGENALVAARNDDSGR